MIDNRTPNYDWPLIHPDNFQEEDVPRLVLTLLQIDDLIASIQLALSLISAEAIGALPVNGTALAAERLATARRINGVLFDGTADIEINSGTFVAVPAAADVSIGPLEFAHITNAAAAVTVTLPAEPTEGQLVMVGNLTTRRDHRAAVGVVPVKGRAAGGFVVLDKPHTTVTFKYVDAVYGWEIV